MSRAMAVRYCQKAHENETIMISISDPYGTYSSSPRATPANGVKSILRLEFCDADRPGADVYNRMVTEQELMTDEDAAKVAAFVKANAEKDVIVHCDAGISRSVGVAAAIEKYRTGSDKRFFGGYYHPNMRAYRKTLNALME